MTFNIGNFSHQFVSERGTKMVYLKRYGKQCFKLSFYLVLLALYIYLYFVESVIELLKRRTAFSGKFETVTEMPLPTLTVCFKPYFRPSLSEQHNINSMISLLENDKLENKWAMFETLSYTLGKDVFFEGHWFRDGEINTHELKEGTNEFPKGTIEIMPVATLRHGKCYILKKDFNVSVTKVTYFAFKVTTNPSLPSSDIPLEYEIIMTSHNGWYGLMADDWPYFEPTTFSITTQPSYHYEWAAVLVPTKLHFQKGYEDIKGCLKEFVHNLTCDTKCYPVVFNTLPDLDPCTNLLDHQCMYNQGVNLEKIKMVSCLKPTVTMQYRTQPLVYDWKPSLNTSILLWIWYDSNQLEMKTEAFVMDIRDFLGSVGGSLGLFLGFSLFSYLSFLLDKVFEKIAKQA